MKFNIKEFFKYNPAKDAQKTFNIEEALNQNWDKVNEMGQDLSDDITKVNTNLRGGNLLVNSNFKIWKKGENFQASGLQYTADMWHAVYNLAVISKQTISNKTVLRCLGNSTSLHYPSIGQNFEDDFRNSIVGEKLTLSGKIRSLGTPTGISLTAMKNLKVDIPLDGLWHEVSATGIAEDNHLTEFCDVRVTCSCSDKTSGFEVEWLKLEIGDKPTKFIPPKPQADLAECQRYFINFVDEGDVNWGKAGTGVCLSATQAEIIVALPCAMRITPTIMQNLLTINDGNGSHNVSSVALTRLTGNQLEIVFNTTGLTVGNGCFLEWRQDLGGYLRLSSEL